MIYLYFKIAALIMLFWKSSPALLVDLGRLLRAIRMACRNVVIVSKLISSHHCMIFRSVIKKVPQDSSEVIDSNYQLVCMYDTSSRVDSVYELPIRSIRFLFEFLRFFNLLGFVVVFINTQVWHYYYYSLLVVYSSNHHLLLQYHRSDKNTSPEKVLF